MREGFKQLEDKLALADQGQDEKAAELNIYADKISSELEMAEVNNKQENDDLHTRLDKEIKMLTWLWESNSTYNTKSYSTYNTK